MRRLLRYLGILKPGPAICTRRVCSGDEKGIITENPKVDVTEPATVVLFQEGKLRAVIEWPNRSPGTIIVPLLDMVDLNRHWAFAVFAELMSHAEPDATKWEARSCGSCGSPCCP